VHVHVYSYTICASLFCSCRRTRAFTSSGVMLCTKYSCSYSFTKYRGDIRGLRCLKLCWRFKTRKRWPIFAGNSEIMSGCRANPHSSITCSWAIDHQLRKNTQAAGLYPGKLPLPGSALWAWAVGSAVPLHNHQAACTSVEHRCNEIVLCLDCW